MEIKEMIIKYTDENGQLNIKCPHNKNVSESLKAVILVGSEFCMRCVHCKKHRSKYNMECVNKM
jgi:hypothetical protein